MMRAKMKVSTVQQFEGGSERIDMHPVAKPGVYPVDGSDEDNTFARFTPGGQLSLNISNPDLYGKFKPGQLFYLDFTSAD
jgi:hypothetical protein